MTTLPNGYSEKRCLVFDDRRMAEAVILGVFLFIGSSLGFYRFFEYIRPESFYIDFIYRGDGVGLTLDFSLILGFAFSVLAVHILHELTHGVFYWKTTGVKPKLEAKGLALMVSEGKSYLYKRNEYIMIGVAPLMLLTLGGCICGLFVTASMMLLVFMFLVFNVSGSAGDIIMIIWLLRLRRDTLIAEDGSRIIAYESTG